MNPEDQSSDKALTETEELLAPGEVVIGEICGLSANGEALVDFSLNPSSQPLSAISTTAVTRQHFGRQVVLMFTDGRLEQPVIVGLIHSPLQDMIENFEFSAAQPESGESDAAIRPAEDDISSKDVSVDGKRVVLEGQNEIVLKCGEASITLTRAGKIMIRGKYLLNRSTGVNRILGGSVQVN